MSEYAISSLGTYQAPVYGPSTAPPATAFGRLNDSNPVWWFPPLGSFSCSGLEWWLHATHPLGGTIAFGLLAAISTGIGGMSARNSAAGGETAGGSLIMAGVSVLMAFGCQMGGSMAAPVAVVGTVAGLGSLIPEWLSLHREKKRHHQQIDQQRMHRQYDWEAGQQRLTEKALEVEAIAYGVRRPDVELERIEAGIRALTSRLDGIPLSGQTARPELTVVDAVEVRDDDLMALAGPLFAYDVLPSRKDQVG